MDLKSAIIIEIAKNERTFQFVMPVGAPFGECYDACFETLNKIVELSKQAVEAAKQPDKVDAQVVDKVN